MSPATASIVVLISGQGRNLQALIDGIRAGRVPAQIKAVISNKGSAAGLLRAREAGIPTAVLEHKSFPDRAAFDTALAAEIDRHHPDIVVLAGFMRILTDGFVLRYKGRLLNIHPSLLPRYPGLDTHQKALDAGDAQHGATVHFVTEQLDGGPCIIQGGLSVKADDTAQTLAERVMNDIELKIYPQAVTWMARGELALREGQVRFRGQPLAAPLGMDDLAAEFR